MFDVDLLLRFWQVDIENLQTRLQSSIFVLNNTQSRKKKSKQYR